MKYIIAISTGRILLQILLAMKSIYGLTPCFEELKEPILKVKLKLSLCFF